MSNCKTLLAAAAAGTLFGGLTAAEENKTPEYNYTHRIKCISHAGDAKSAPPHSPAAYRIAMQHKADFVKLDIHYTKDEIPVLSHDQSMKRTMKWNALIREKTLEELRRKTYLPRCGYDSEKIMTLPEALKIIKDCPEFWFDPKGFYKYLKMLKKTFPEFEKAGIDINRVIIATWTDGPLRYAMRDYPQIRRVKHIQLFRRKNGTVANNIGFPQKGGNREDIVKLLLKECKKRKLYGLNLPIKGIKDGLLTAGDIKILRDAGIWCSMWFVNTAEDAKLAAAAGADAIVTDKLEAVRPYCRIPGFKAPEQKKSSDNVKKKRKKMINVRDCGAIGDGKTLDTAAIQKALDTGKIVYFPAGTYYTGTIYLRSNGGIHLEKDAKLLASTNPSDYNRNDFSPQNSFSVKEKASGAHLIIAQECENVSIDGEGTIDGNGKSFFDTTVNESHNPMRPMYRRLDWRPGQMLYFYGCKNVTIRHITLREASYWHCFLHNCDNVEVTGVTIACDPKMTNTDGIDIDCSRKVRVSGCNIDCGDDSIAIRANDAKIGYTAPCEDVVIENCKLVSVACAVRIGVGGGIIKGVTLRNLDISNSALGIVFCPRYTKVGLQIEDVRISDCSIKARQALVMTPVWCCINYDTPDLPIRNIFFENITAETIIPCTFVAPEKNPSVYSNINFKNCSIKMLSPSAPAKRTRWPLEEYGVLNFLRIKPGIENVKTENSENRKGILIKP